MPRYVAPWALLPAPACKPGLPAFYLVLGLLGTLALLLHFPMVGVARPFPCSIVIALGPNLHLHVARRPSRRSNLIVIEPKHLLVLRQLLGWLGPTRTRAAHLLVWLAQKQVAPRELSSRQLT